jgi:O-antigen/teichoic acid export membrane protein
MKSEALDGSESIVLSITFFLILSFFLTNHSVNKLRTVVPTILSELGFKIFLPLLILAYAYWGFGRIAFGYSIAAFFLGISIVLLFYLKSIDGLKFGRIKRPSSDFSYLEMAKYALFGCLNQFGNKLAFRLDTIMIALILTDADVSFYIKAFVFTSFIEMPLRAFNQIASPILSKAWNENDISELKNVYQKTSVNLFVTGCFLFLGLWYSLNDLVNISADPSKFPHVEIIFLLLGLSKLMDLASSVNNLIIAFSKFYKYNLIFLLFLGVSNLLMNFYLIPEHGIIGAAIATSISMFMYNLIKFLFIIYKFKLQPFTRSTIKTLILFLIVFALYFVIPFNFSPFINIIVKSIFVAVVYLPIAYFWNISKDINNLVTETKNKIILRIWN